MTPETLSAPESTRPAGSSAASGSTAESSSPATSQLPAVLSGMFSKEEWAKLAPEDQKKWETKAVQLDGDYRKKTEALAHDRKSVQTLKELNDSLEADPELKERFQQALKLAKDGGPLRETKSQAKAMLDEWIEETEDPKARRQLTQLREIIKQETNVEAIKQELADLKKQMSGVAKHTSLTRQESLRTALSELPKDFQPLVEKYDEQLHKLGGQYPSLSPKKLLQLSCTDEEYETAVKADLTRETKKEASRLKDVAGAKPSSTTSTEPLTSERLPRKSGWFGERHNLGKLVEKVHAEVKGGPSD